MTTSKWYKGGKWEGRGWLAAAKEYAAFFGPTTAVEVPPGDDILDLRYMGVSPRGDEDYDLLRSLGMRALDDVYMSVETAPESLRDRYRAIRCLQWHADYSDDVQDTLFVL